jgi:hypothetical protein
MKSIGGTEKGECRKYCDGEYDDGGNSHSLFSQPCRRPVRALLFDATRGSAFRARESLPQRMGWRPEACPRRQSRGTGHRLRQFGTVMETSGQTSLKDRALQGNGGHRGTGIWSVTGSHRAQ